MAPAWLDELHLRPGPPWHAMGTRAMVADAWLGRDAEFTEQIERKRELLDDAHDVVAAALPGSEDASAEAAALVAEAAGANLDPERPPLQAAALLAPEDLCVLEHRGGRWVLTAGVVAFPSMWRLPDKLGLLVSAVHDPVPYYGEELADRVDRFLDRLRPEGSAWRRNWFVHDSPELHLPGPPAPPCAPDDGPHVPGGLWLRSERQTLRRLPETGAILFTIRTQQVPFGVLAERPDTASAMAAAIRAWPPDLADYRGAGRWRDRAVAWLQSIASTSPATTPARSE